MIKEIMIGALVFTLLIGITGASAQELRLAGIQYATYPKVDLKDDANGFDVAFQEFAAFINIPKMLKNKRTILINGVNYAFVQSKFSNNSFGVENSQTFHRIIYTLMLVHRWKGPWMLSARLAPTLATDFKDPLSTEDFIIQSSIVASKKSSERVRWGGGFIYTTRLGRPLFLPAVQYVYKGERNLLNIFLPAFIDYKYALGDSKRLEIGAKIGLNGANFNASTDNNAGLDVDRLNYVRVNMGPQISYQLTKMLQLDVFGGVSGKRMYKFKDVHGDTYNYDSKSGAFFSVGLVVVPPKKKQ